MVYTTVYTTALTYLTRDYQQFDGLTRDDCGLAPSVMYNGEFLRIMGEFVDTVIRLMAVETHVTQELWREDFFSIFLSLATNKMFHFSYCVSSLFFTTTTTTTRTTTTTTTNN